MGMTSPCFGKKQSIQLLNPVQKRICIGIILLAGFSLSMPVCSAQSAAAVAEWEKQNNAGKAALQSGKFADAELKLKAALEICNKKLPPADSHRIETLSNLADLYNRQNNNELAGSFYQQAVEVAEKAGGQNCPSNLSGCLNNLAAHYFKLNKLAQAEGLMLRALSLDEKAFGATSPNLLTELNNLADLYKAESKLPEAEAVFKRIVSIQEKNSPGSPNHATALDTLATFYRACKRPAEAEAPDKQALAMLEKKFGKDNVQLVACLNNLGNTYKALKNFDEAEASYKRALEINEKLKSSDLVLVKSYRNLAKLYKLSGKTADAEIFYKRTIAIDEANAAAKSELPKDMESYADLLRKTDREDEALALEAKAQALVGGAGGGDDKQAMENKPESSN